MPENFDVVHVAGDLDARHVISRQAQQVQRGVHLYSGHGVPPAAMGANGDIYLRVDGGVGSCIYQRRSGAWVASGA
jgi:hypothetical protein